MATFREDLHTGHKVPLVETDDILNKAVTTEKIDDGAVTTEKLNDRAVSAEKIVDNSITTAKVADGAVTSPKLQSESITTEKVVDNAVTESKLATGAVTTQKILDGAVTTDKIADGTIQNSKISNNALTGEKFANNSISGEKILDNSIPGSKLQDGSIESVDIKDGTLSGSKLVDNSISGDKLADNAVIARKLADSSITTPKIDNGAVTTDKIANGAITTDKIINGNITTAKIADEAVVTRKIADSNITTAKIADGSVTTDKLNNKSVTTEKIASGAVETSKLGDNAVTTDKIADSNVITEKIADGAITTSKVANGCITENKIASNAVTTAKIADGAVTVYKIPDNAVTTDKINSGAVTTAKIPDSNITTDKIANGAVATAKIADGAVTTAKIPDNNVTTPKINDGAVTTAKIPNENITTPKIADGAVSTDKIANGAVTNSKLADGAVTSDKLADGLITELTTIMDEEPTEDSVKPVTSGGIFEWCNTLIATVMEWANNIFAKIDGYYETMVVGAAKNLEGHNITEGTFFSRPTGGEDAELANGLAQLQAVKGNSVKYNQLVQNGNFASSSGWQYNYATTTFANNSVTLTKEAISGSNYSHLYRSIPTIPIGHKVFMCIEYASSRTGVYFELCNTTGHKTARLNLSKTNLQRTILTGVLTTADLESKFVDVVDYNDYALTLIVYNIQIIDLTLIFGAGNEPTKAQFEAWMAANWGAQQYYPYSAGSVINVNMTGVESFKRNLLNPTTGKAYILGAYSETYGNYYGICGTYGTLTFKDAYGNESTITPDADGKFELNVAGELTVADAGADCAVFLWWDGTETEYSEYGTSIAKLDISHIYGKLNGAGELVRVWPTGAPGLGTLQDYLKLEDGAVVAKRIWGEKNLGNLTWSKILASQFRTLDITDYKYNFSYDNPNAQPIIIVKYSKADAKSLFIDYDAPDKTCGFYNSNVTKHFAIQDSSFSTAEDCKSGLAGVMLYYVLQTPETYTDLVYIGSELYEDGTPVTLPVNYEADNWGIERVLPLNTPSAMVTSAPTIESKYSLDAVEQLDTHSAEIADLYNKNAIMDAKKANKVGEFPDMVVGSAAALKGDTPQSAEFVLRPTGSPDKVAIGIAQMEAIKGKSLVWNQLVQNGNFASASGWSYDTTSSTISINNGVCTVTAKKNNDDCFVYRNINTIPAGHKVFLRTKVESTDYNYCRVRLFNNWTSSQGYDGVIGNISYIFTTNGNKNILDIRSNQNRQAGNSFSVEYVILIDLTLMFGAGNEPTAAQFEAMYPLPYYAYNAGTLINNKTTGIEAVGFNQWDEEWESGALSPSSGQPYADNTCIVSKNYIKVFPNTVYNFKKPTSVAQRQAYYDANKNFISFVDLFQTSGTGGTFTTPDNAYYMKFHIKQTSYNNNVCINLSDASKNDTYEPYKKSSLELNIPTLTGKLNGEGESVVICADGMRGVGTAFDGGVVENGYLTKIVKRVGQQVVSGAIGDTITLTGCNTNATTFLCAKEIGTLSGGVLTLTAAASNVEVYFPLAEPQVYVLDTPIPVNYQVDGGGTERRLPEDTASEVNAPFVADILYSMDAVGTLNNLPKNYDNTGGLDDLCTALATALGGALNGTLSIQRGAYNATTQKYAWTVTFTPNA